jgi:protein-tyrosine-phosphatase
MAEAIANDLFVKKQMRFQAFSRGLNVLIPARASENAVKALRFLYKLDLESHISRQVTAADMEKASLVLTMTESHKNYLNLAFAKYEEKIYTLNGFAGQSGKDIKDPYGMDLFMYKSCAEEINSIVQKVFI